MIPGKRLRSVTDKNRWGGQYGRIAEGCVSNVQVLRSVVTDCEHTVPRTGRKSGEIKKKGCVTDAGRSQSAMRKVWYRPEAERCQTELAALSTRADSAAGSFYYHSMSSDNTTEHPLKECANIEVLSQLLYERLLQQAMEQNRQILRNEVSACLCIFILS